MSMAPAKADKGIPRKGMRIQLRGERKKIKRVKINKRRVKR